MAPLDFNLRTGKHRILAALVLTVCIAAWVVQLAGVASLQAVCKHDLSSTLANHEVDFLKNFVAQAPLLLGNGATPISQPALYQLLAGTVKSLALVGSRTTSVFTLTPDDNCADYYRYQWLNTWLQFVVLVLAFVSLLSGFLHTARVAVCCLLSVASVLAIENAHTFFYVRHFAPDETLVRGKVFFAGCVITAGANLFLLFVLGTHDELAGYGSRASSEANYGPGNSHHAAGSKDVNDPHGKAVAV